MIRLSKIHLIFVFLLISSCSWLNHQLSPDFPDSSDFINRFPANRQGVILFKLKSRYPSTLWCKYDKNGDVVENDCFEIKPSNYYQILMAEPGLYEIRGYEKTTRFYNESRINPRFSPKNHARKTKPIMAFEIKEGKISFLGEINYKSSKLVKNFSYDDEFNRIKDLFVNKDLKKLKKTFLGHKYQAKFLNLRINGEVDEYLIKDYVKTAKNFKKIKKKSKKKTKKKKLKSKYGY